MEDAAPLRWRGVAAHVSQQVQDDRRKMIGTRRSRPAEGQSLVEFALVLPILAMLMFGIFDLGRFVFAYADVAGAAREGSRFGLVHPLWVTATDAPDPNNITFRARQKVWLMDPGAMTVEVTYPDTISPPPKMGERIRVTVSAPFEMVTPILSDIYHSVIPEGERQIAFVSTRTIMQSEDSATPTATPSPSPSPTETATETPTPPDKSLAISFEPGYPARQLGANKPIFVKVRVVDELCVAVNDASVTFTAEDLRGTLIYNDGTSGVYGDGMACWSGGALDENVSVIVTASKAGYSSGSASAVTATQPSGGCP